MNILEEKIIIKNLIKNDEYFLKVFPYLNEKQFSEVHTKKLFSCIKMYNEKYNHKPVLSVLKLFVEQANKVTASTYAEMKEIVDYIEQDEYFEYSWLCDKTLEFIQTREYYNALSDGIDKFDKQQLDNELPEKLIDALSISFDNEIGMSFDNAEERWNCYTIQEDKVPFMVEKLNEITKGGVTRKTLNCLMSANTGGFKSGTMCSFASDYMRMGYNVLYLSFEMAEDKILERIDANLLNVNIDDIVNLGKENYVNKITKLKETTQGKIIVKQYPTSMVHTGHIRNLLKELKLKQKFIPDVIVFDYLGIMTSQRYGNSGAAEHQIIKAATEEVRGLCVEFNCVGWTAMQSNRGGAERGEGLSISDISSSYGAAFGFDMIIGIITSPELDEQHEIVFKQIKNRYGDANINSIFHLGLDKPKMKVFDLLTANNKIFITNDEVEKLNEQRENDIFANKFNTISNVKTNTISNIKFY